MDTIAELDDIVARIVGCACEVANTLGPGFLERVYERTFTARHQSPISSGVPSGVQGPMREYVADLVVEDRVIVELKCVEAFSREHMAQCINYLKASHWRLAILINFQKPEVEWRRIIYG